MALPIDKDVVVSTDVDASGGVSEQPALCNYLEGNEEDLALQRTELAPAGVSIQPEGDNNYCSYVAGDEFVKSVEFPKGYVVREGSFYQDARFIYFNKGSPSEVPERFRQYEGSSSKIEVAEFLTIEVQDAGVGDDETQLSAREALLNYIKEKWPNAEIIDVDLRMDGTVANHRRYVIYIAGYNLPKPGEEVAGGAKIPEFATEYCPEWVLHQQAVMGAAALEGWEIIKSPSPLGGEGRGEGAYLAIPREELKEEIGGKLGRTELYAEDLRSKLGFSEYMKGDNPIRLLKEITFIGADGVAGLECPVFKVNILEIPKTEDNCLAWVMRDIEKAERAKKKAMEVAGGYLIANGGGAFKYIAPTGKLDIEAVKAVLSRKIPDVDGFDKTITARQVLYDKDKVCSAFELNPSYTKLPEVQSDPATARRGGDDMDKLQKRFYSDPRVLEKLNKLGRLGDVTWVRSRRGGEPAKDLIGKIVSLLHEDEPVERMEVAFVVDQSGSMFNNVQSVNNQFGEIEAEVAASAEDSALALVKFRNEDIKVLVPLEIGQGLDISAGRVRTGLNEITSDIGGSLEYIYDAAGLALDEFERHGVPGSRRKIILITDEPGDLQEGGETEASIRARAAELGVEFQIVFLAGGDNYIFPYTEYLKYLEKNNIDIAGMNEKERIAVWGRILNEPDTIHHMIMMSEVNEYTLGLLSEVSRANQAEAVSLIKTSIGSDGGAVGWEAFEALEKMSHPDARRAVSELMKSKPEWLKSYLKYKADGIDDENGRVTWEGGGVGPEMMSRVQDGFDPKFKDLYKEASKLLKEPVNRNDVGALERLARAQDTPLYLKQGIIYILGKIGTPEAVNVAEGFLKSSSLELRREAVIAVLAHKYDPTAIAAGIELLRNYDKGKTAFSTWELYEVIGPHTKRISNEILKGLLEGDEWSENKIFAILALYKNGYSAAGKMLKDLLKAASGNSIYSGNILYHIALIAPTIGGEEMIDVYERALECRSYFRNKLGFLSLLEKVGGEKAIALLEKWLDKETDPNMIRNIAEVLGKIGDARSTGRLIKLLDDMDRNVRERAAQALEKIGDGSAIPELARLLDDPSNQVVKAAGDAIKAITERLEREKFTPPQDQ